MDGTGDVWCIGSLPFLEGQFRGERPPLRIRLWIGVCGLGNEYGGFSAW